MARAKLGKIWGPAPGPRYFGAAFISTRAAPGPRQARTKEFLNEAAPGPGLNSLHGQRSHDSRAYRARAEANELYRSTSALYMACPVRQLSRSWPGSWMVS